VQRKRLYKVGDSYINKDLIFIPDMIQTLLIVYASDEFFTTVDSTGRISAQPQSTGLSSYKILQRISCGGRDGKR
jgi:hypothetical protein